MSRSCQSATSSSAGTTALRTTRSRCLFGSGIASGKDRAQKALRNALNSKFGVELSPTVTLDYPSVAALASHLAAQLLAAAALLRPWRKRSRRGRCSPARWLASPRPAWPRRSTPRIVPMTRRCSWRPGTRSPQRLSRWPGHWQGGGCCGFEKILELRFSFEVIQITVRGGLSAAPSRLRRCGGERCESWGCWLRSQSL